VCVCVCVLTGPVSQHSEMNAECFTSPGRTLRNTVTHRERESRGCEDQVQSCIKDPWGKENSKQSVCERNKVLGRERKLCKCV